LRRNKWWRNALKKMTAQIIYWTFEQEKYQVLEQHPEIPLSHYAVRTLESLGLSYNLSMIPQEENWQKSIKTDTNTGQVRNWSRWNILQYQCHGEKIRKSNLNWVDLKMIKVKLPTLRIRVTKRCSPKWDNPH
jgi:hypothetical protein